MQSKNAKAAVKLCKLTRVIRHMPVLTSHILIVLSLDPDSKNGPGLPLFLVYRKHIKMKFPGQEVSDLNDNYPTMICISNFVKTHFLTNKNDMYFRHTTYVLSYVYKWLLQLSQLTQSSPHITTFVCVMYPLSKFQVYSTVLLTTVTMLYIRFLELSLQLEVCTLWPTSCHFLLNASPWQTPNHSLFVQLSQIPHVTLYSICLSLSNFT